MSSWAGHYFTDQMGNFLSQEDVATSSLQERHSVHVQVCEKCHYYTVIHERAWPSQIVKVEGIY